MRRESLSSKGLTLSELLMVSFVLSIVVVCIFRALTLFTQGAMKIQRDLPVQRTLQAAGFMLTADLLASPRSAVNNLLPNPGFEDMSNTIEMSPTPTAGTWSYPPKRMGWSPNASYYFVRNQSALDPKGNHCMAIFNNWAQPVVTSPAMGPAEKTEPYLFSLVIRTTIPNPDAKAEVRGGATPLAFATLLGSFVYGGNWAVRSSSFSATPGQYHQVKLSVLPSSNIGAFDNVYLGPFSVEVSTSHLSGRLWMTRSNGSGELERVEYTMTLGANGGGRLVRKLTPPTGTETTSFFDGIDSLKVSWVGAPLPNGGTDRPLLVELSARKSIATPADALTLSFEVFPRVP